MPGLFKKNGRWWIDYRDAEGVRVRKPAAGTARVAQEVLNHTLDKVAREEIGIIDSSMSFKKFSEEWSHRVLKTVAVSTAIRWQGIIDNHLQPFFKGNLKSITMARGDDYVAARLEAKATPATVNREMGCLRHMMRRAVKWKHLARNPISEWEPLEEAPGRTRFASEDEIERLLAACEKSRSRYLRPFVLVSMNTGMRRGEILSLMRPQIDWANRIATIAKTKNGEEGKVPLNETAMEALRSLPIRIDGRLFPFKDGDAVSTAFRRACERAGIKNFRLHDLRHTFASHHAMKGKQQRALQALLRHKDTRMTMRYSHLTDSYLRDAVDAVNLGGAKQGQRADTAPRGFQR